MRRLSGTSTIDRAHSAVAGPRRAASRTARVARSMLVGLPDVIDERVLLPSVAGRITVADLDCKKTPRLPATLPLPLSGGVRC